MSEKSPKNIKNTCKTNIYKFRANSKKAQQVNPSPFKSAQVPWTYFFQLKFLLRNVWPAEKENDYIFVSMLSIWTSHEFKCKQLCAGVIYVQGKFRQSNFDIFNFCNAVGSSTLTKSQKESLNLWFFFVNSQLLWRINLFYSVNL